MIIILFQKYGYHFVFNNMKTILLTHDLSKYGKEPDTLHTVSIFVHSPKTGKDVGCPQSFTWKVIASVEQYVIGNTKKVYIGNTASKVKLRTYWESNCLCLGGQD